MFERFTDRARRVVAQSLAEARALRHDHIGPEHLLLALLRETEGDAVRALTALGISAGTVRARVEELIGTGQEPPSASGHVPFTAGAKESLELSLRESLDRRQRFIGTEHLLLGLIRAGDGVAAQVLVGLGADLDRVRDQVSALLAERRGRPRLGEPDAVPLPDPEPGEPGET